jgi:hypothetical protein
LVVEGVQVRIKIPINLYRDQAVVVVEEVVSSRAL